jgi:hypothetical protein
MGQCSYNASELRQRAAWPASPKSPTEDTATLNFLPLAPKKTITRGLVGAPRPLDTPSPMHNAKAAWQAVSNTSQPASDQIRKYRLRPNKIQTSPPTPLLSVSRPCHRLALVTPESPRIEENARNQSQRDNSQRNSLTFHRTPFTFHFSPFTVHRTVAHFHSSTYTHHSDNRRKKRQAPKAPLQMTPRLPFCACRPRGSRSHWLLAAALVALHTIHERQQRA